MNRILPLTLLSLLSVMNVACVQQPVAEIELKGDKFYGWKDNGASEPNGTKVISRSPSSIVAGSSTSSQVITVKKSQGLYALARKYQVDPKEIIALNRLSPPYALNEGQRLVIPSDKFHRVEPKETLLSIARHYKTTPEALAAANHLTPPYVIKKGQLLKIETNTTQIAKAEPIKQPVVQQSKQPVQVTSLKQEAAPVNIATTDQNVLNKKTVSPWEQKSQVIQEKSAMNPVKDTKVPTAANTGTIQSVPLAPLPRTHVAGPSAVQESATALENDQSAIEVDKDAETKQEEVPAVPGKFIWPVQGEILSNFGPRRGGVRNDGINIAAPEGAVVKAADNGTVVYAGNELRGYGNLLIIKHDNGLFTAYAHQKNIVVQKGERVRRGQAIGYVGTTGNVSRPQLHFGVRIGKKAVDPMNYLAKANLS